MEKKIQDYLHLYLGCRVLYGEGHYGDLSPLTYKQTLDYIEKGYLVKLVLRPLSTMTEEDVTEMFLLKGMTKPDKVLRTNIEDRFMQIEYKHAGVTDSDYQHIITMYPQQFQYLLSRGFDLFGLIDAGLAIDKTLPSQQ